MKSASSVSTTSTTCITCSPSLHMHSSYAPAIYKSACLHTVFQHIGQALVGACTLESKERTNPPLRSHPSAFNRKFRANIQVKANGLRTTRVLFATIKVDYVVNFLPAAVNRPVMTVKRGVITVTIEVSQCYRRPAEIR